MGVFSRLMFVGLLAASAAGCASPAENGIAQLSSAEKNFPIKVEPQVATLVVLVDSDGRGLVGGEEEGVAAFAEQWKVRGHGAISVSVPQGGSGESEAKETAKDVTRILKANGVDKESVHVSDYKAEANDVDAPITLSFVADVAIAAECGQNWSENIAFNPRNQPYPDFGCSSQHNLAAMIDDPRDLDRPHPTDKPDALRRGTVLQKYRQGEATYTTLSGTRDSGVVSDMKQQ